MFHCLPITANLVTNGGGEGARMSLGRGRRSVHRHAAFILLLGNLNAAVKPSPWIVSKPTNGTISLLNFHPRSMLPNCLVKLPTAKHENHSRFWPSPMVSCGALLPANSVDKTLAAHPPLVMKPRGVPFS